MDTVHAYDLYVMLFSGFLLGMGIMGFLREFVDRCRERSRKDVK
jgi:hypothetical protein